MASKLKDQQAVRPAVLIAVAAVGAAAVAFFIVNMLVGGGGGSSSAPATTVTRPAVAPLPNLNVPTAPPAPPGSGRDPFQPVAGAGATPAPVAAAPGGSTPRERVHTALETPAPTANGEFQSTAGTKQYVEVISVAADHKLAKIRDGSIVYEQARPGQTLANGIVVDAIDSKGCVRLHRGTTSNVLCAGSKVLM